MDQAALDSFRKAGRIAAECREWAKDNIRPGVRIQSVLEAIEDKIRAEKNQEKLFAEYLRSVKEALDADNPKKALEILDILGKAPLSTTGGARENRALLQSYREAAQKRLLDQDLLGLWPRWTVTSIPGGSPGEPRTQAECDFDAAEQIGAFVPREDGGVLVGSTLEYVGFRKEVTAGAIGHLLDAAARLCPEVTSARFVTAWAGLRPGTPDGWPVLGESGVAGLFLAAGHYRNGILLAPATARRMADLATGRPAPELSPFSVERFACLPSNV